LHRPVHDRTPCRRLGAAVLTDRPSASSCSPSCLRRANRPHSDVSPAQLRLIFDYIDSMVLADRFLTPPPELAPYAFNFYDWERRNRRY
jgi:hypothetical protein